MSGARLQSIMMASACFVACSDAWQSIERTAFLVPFSLSLSKVACMFAEPYGGARLGKH